MNKIVDKLKKKEIQHKTGNSAVTDIALEREEKEEEVIISFTKHELREQGLTLLNERDAVLSLWYNYDST